MVNILVIAGEYPPLKTIGRIRSAKFVQHWHNAGHNPVVLTLHYDKTEPHYEDSLQDEIPAGIKVYRVKNAKREDTLLNLIKSLRRAKAVNPQQQQSQSTSTQTTAKPANLSLKDRLIIGYKSLFRHWLDIPDDYVVWAKDCLPQALELIKQHNIDVIYTSLPPFSACKLGYQLKQQTGLPWVVDYRDLWTGDVLREWIHPLRGRYETHLERKYVRHADAVVTVSQQKTDFVKALLNQPNQQYHTITNGYDPESFNYLAPSAKADTALFNIVYCGRLFKNRKGYAFLHALGQISTEKPELTQQVKLHFYGDIAPEINAEYDKLIAQYQLQQQVIRHGDVSFEQAKQAQVDADMLLLIVDTGATSDGVIPGKLFEYIACNKPIFALSDATATNEILLQGKLGPVVSPDDIVGCKTALVDILNNPFAPTSSNQSYLQQFERKAKATAMAELFRQLANK